jgi:hypothetical protein
LKASNDDADVQHDGVDGDETEIVEEEGLREANFLAAAGPMMKFECFSP